MALKVRTEKPAYAYTNYRAFKPALRVEFNYSCVYCDIWETELGGKASFHIDHYKPKSRPEFAHLRADYDNLLYSCRDCNDYKDVYWPNAIERALQKFFLNPCIHHLDKHIDNRQPVWIHKSKAGKFNIDELHLCGEYRVRMRKEREALPILIEAAKNSLKDARQQRIRAQMRGDAAVEHTANLACQHFETAIQMYELRKQKKLD